MSQLLRTWALLLVTGTASLAFGQIRIEVFALFEPHELSASGSPVSVRTGDHQSYCELLQISYLEDRLRLQCGNDEWTARRALLSSPGGVSLSVPGKIRRRFPGNAIEISAQHAQIQAHVHFPLESAVAAVVAAEMERTSSAAALEAQAIAARSYFLAARRRHPGGTFCDTTHCQFLRAVPSDRHPAARAAGNTRGLVLSSAGTVIDAQYSRQCGGKTRRGAGYNGYEFASVVCPGCRQNPSQWSREIPSDAADEIVHQPSENARLALVRQLGWNAVPALPSTTRPTATSVVLYGSGQGHGFGLCQLGAQHMARSGASAAAILRHYFPGTSLERR